VKIFIQSGTFILHLSVLVWLQFLSLSARAGGDFSLDPLIGTTPPLEEYVEEGNYPATGRILSADDVPIVNQDDLDFVSGEGREANDPCDPMDLMGTSGSSYVVQASGNSSLEPSYCTNAAEWEKQICSKAIASNNARNTGAAARLSSNSNNYNFTSAEKQSVNSIFRNVKASIFRILAQSNLPDAMKRKIKKKLAKISISNLSYTEDANTISNSSDKRNFKNWCSSKSTDNAYYSDSQGDLVLCPGHLAKAFSGSPNHGYPEEVLALNIAHELTHSIDFHHMPGNHYNGLTSCYNDNLAQSSSGGFGNQSDSLCCCQSGSRGSRSCSNRTHCPSSCNVGPYMGEAVGDNWANDVVGYFSKNWKITQYQQGARIGVRGAGGQITYRHRLIYAGQRGLTQSEKFDLVARNLYWYCTDGLDASGRLNSASSHDYVHPSHRFRLMEARRNPHIAGALGCSVDNTSLSTRSLGKACWDSSRSNFVARP